MDTTTLTAIKQAADAQERRVEGWGETALSYLKTFAQFNQSFTAEDVRLASVDVVPVPEEGRAWGAIFQQAARAGIIASNGYVAMKSKQSHGKPTTLWVSKIFTLTQAA